MPVATICGQRVHTDEEGFLTELDEWNDDIAEQPATNSRVELGDRHWEIIRWLRADFKETGFTATTRRTPIVGGFPVKEQFTLFPKKPATKMMKKQIADLGVPDVPEFLQQVVDEGGHLWACRMSADMMGLTEEDLFEGVAGIINANAFIEMTGGAQLLFI